MARKSRRSKRTIVGAAKSSAVRAISQYERSREESCVQLDGRPPLFRSIPVPLR
jgi:hypothetical protein